MSICFLNDKYLDLQEAKISPLDRGFLFGDAIYEVIIAVNKKPFELGAHLTRLKKNISSLKYSLSDQFDLEETILEVISRNKFLNQVIYVQISRGTDIVRDHTPSNDLSPTIFVSSHELKTDFSPSSGEKAILLEDFRWRKGQIKATSLLANVIYRSEAKNQEVFETILFENGFITEGAVSNVFCCIDNKILTPPLTENILPGVTRKVILELIQDMSFEYEETKITVDSFLSAEEIWVTNSTKGVIPIIELDGKKIGSGLPGEKYLQISKAFISKLSG
ncbi:aminotransferase class IV [Gammaproteobacteria bacterium]|nr:aminotransferase class IV [Gammaproteobacteria bacterium]